MGSLADTEWDVLIAGTNFPQSLLALALSRAGKKVLHIDKNDYYGGSEAALSLQEAEAWAKTANEEAGPSPFRHVTIKNLEQGAKDAEGGQARPKLGFSRAYSLSLSPQLIYSRSNLLPALVSSKVYRQLEFLAVGSWWTYNEDDAKEERQVGQTTARKGSLRRIPGGREDIFADKEIDLRSTRTLMRFLKLATDPDAHISILEDWGDKPFPEFLQNHLGVEPRLQAPLLALTLSPNFPAETMTSYALPRIHRHLTSIGIFGPGFGSVIPKWGGLSEIAQVACRAGAVGGATYVLKRGLERYEDAGQPELNQEAVHSDQNTGMCIARLQGGEQVKSRWIVGSLWDLPSQVHHHAEYHNHAGFVARSITIVSGSLSLLFPNPAEGAPPPAGAVVFYPTGTLELKPGDQTRSTLKSDPPPVYLMVHSSDTGECPTGQCIIYAYTSHPSSGDAYSILQSAVDQLLASINEDPPVTVLWRMHYDQEYLHPATTGDYDADIKCSHLPNGQVLQLPDLAPTLALEDHVLKHVKAAYHRIISEEGPEFMIFDDRDGTGDDGNDE